MQKDDLLLYCLQSDSLSLFFPTYTNIKAVTREYILQVSLIFNIKVIRANDRANFKSLNRLVRQYKIFKKQGQHSNYQIMINQEFANKILDHLASLGKLFLNF